ncbi:hypothetical protein SK128_016677 [Halocaridina rubra]|uniref:Uncharacterized protein n=1 Tax=Halocaridina rubra TaxID=373956 RepID=A0AAN9A635_HALRR
MKPYPTWRWSPLMFAVVVVATVVTDDTKRGPRVKELLQEDDRNSARLLATYATTTYTVITAKTSTVYFSCLSGTAATVCGGRGGRRRKRFLKDIPIEEQTYNDEIQLEGSSAKVGEDVLTKSGNDKNARFGITIWTTTKTTSSVTVFYTNTASTLRLSYYCVAGGINLPATPCSG